MAGGDDIDEKVRRVLAIQSHVAHGFVGNRCADLVLQTLGFEVCVVCTVHLACHTGYGPPKGWIMNESEFDTILEGLRNAKIVRRGPVSRKEGVSHILTGFCRNAKVLSRIVGLLDELGEEVAYVCDPVLGDNGKCYVPEECVTIFRDELLPRATLALPNNFELAKLTDRDDIRTEKEAFESLATLIGRGTKGAVCTGVPVSEDEIVFFGDVPSSWCDDVTLETPSDRVRFKISVPRLPGAFTGTGDLLAALILARWDENPTNFPYACVQALSSLSAVLTKTSKHTDTSTIPPPELALVPSLQYIQSPPDVPSISLTILS